MSSFFSAIQGLRSNAAPIYFLIVSVSNFLHPVKSIPASEFMLASIERLFNAVHPANDTTLK